MSGDGLTPDEVVEAKHALAGVAELLHEYYAKLRDEGFSRREAMQFVLDYQRTLVKGSTES